MNNPTKFTDPSGYRLRDVDAQVSNPFSEYFGFKNHGGCGGGSFINYSSINLNRIINNLNNNTYGGTWSGGNYTYFKNDDEAYNYGSSYNNHFNSWANTDAGSSANYQQRRDFLSGKISLVGFKGDDNQYSLYYLVNATGKFYVLDTSLEIDPYDISNKGSGNVKVSENNDSGWGLGFHYGIPFVTSPLVDKNSGFTLGPVVVIGTNITLKSKWGRDVIKHEAGHVLYFYLVPLNYYKTNAIPSLVNYWLTDGDERHSNFWTEKVANTLSTIFIGPFEDSKNFPSYINK